SVGDIPDVLNTVVPPPDFLPKAHKVEFAKGPPIGRADRNYLEQEARNSALGRAGEEFALKYERTRLLNMGMDRFAERLEHVAITVGDGEGFDIRSFGDDGS